MKRDEFFRVLEDLDPKLVEEADTGCRPVWPKLLAAACVAAVLAVVYLTASPENPVEEVPLLKSTGVSITVLEQPPAVSGSMADLVWFTEEELLAAEGTDIFRGTVVSIRNLQIDYNGSVNLDAVAEIRVEEVFRGTVQPGDVVTVRLGFPISEGLWVEETDTLAAMEEGISGIFMPVKYREDACREENGAKLYLREIADYGFGDGARFAFLEKEGRLIFAEWAYPSLRDVATLDDVAAFIRQMLD